MPTYQMIAWDFGDEKHLLLGDPIHHPGLEGEVMKFDASVSAVPPTECCCQDNECACIPELEAATYPDLQICLVSNGTDPCDECFSSTPLCGTLTWNGTEYSGSVDFGGGCSRQDAVAVRLACSAVTDDVCFPGLACGLTEWELQIECEEGCFNECNAPTACSPFSMSGTFCTNTRCCVTGPTPGFGCIDYEITVAP